MLSAQPSPVVISPLDIGDTGFFDSPSYRASPGTKALATHWKTAPMAPRMESAYPQGFVRQQRRNGVTLEPFTLTELLQKVQLCELGDGRAEPA